MTQLLACDLDGTIYNRQNGFNDADIDVLKKIGQEGTIRVIATGRTFQSALSVIDKDFPIDYLVFSSGAGIYNWKTQKLLQSTNLGYEQTQKVSNILNQLEVEYTIHHPIPDNHLFFHSTNNNPHPDFERYIDFNKSHAEAENSKLPQLDYSQTLAFVKDMDQFKSIESKLDGIKIIRATSPIDGKSIWMEFFNSEVSKAEGIKQLCKKLNVEDTDVSVIGNDYNDIDMLHHYQSSFIVANAPVDLKVQFENLVEISEAPLADWYKRFHKK
ncbi:HAD family hydrolase [Carboxylicivirga sp. N1Y90]|uniref:HAD family hydrolase n=1 Tax=Carboxylicivirga fragile TaxID=3417571 RepID=UPI003D3381C0|nr:HAD family phosphatase [Marinilabiliaceae bacterium N1Y90]